ncbi:MAG: acyl-CoA dehydrogenase family protein [Myxococcota bacterium]|nr:acyl-CoA/acyl-ACP dehydrogenase [Myxococcales bacterium]
MEFTFGEEHEALRNTVRSFLDAESDEAAVRTAMASERGHDPGLWRRMAGEIGLAGLVVPEVHGGAGMGPVEALVVFEELGRSLACVPALSSYFAVNVVLEVGSEADQAKLLPDLASGRALLTVAHVDAGGRWDLGVVSNEARREGEGSLLDGDWRYVLDGHVADRILAVARTSDGLGVFQVEADAPGVSRKALPGLDLTRRLADLRLDRVAARRLGEGDARAGLERAWLRTIAALAAEQTGAAGRCLELATAYAKSRYQFGRPIGSFQAIKHQCADLLVKVELMRSAAWNAAFVAASGEGDLEVAVRMARSYCAEAGFEVAAQALQIHGGMGFTWEHPIHLYLKRAKSSELLFGSAIQHRERLAERLAL